MYVCIISYIQVNHHTHTCMCLNIHTCVCVHTCMYKYVNTSMHNIHTYTSVCIYIFVQMTDPRIPMCSLSFARKPNSRVRYLSHTHMTHTHSCVCTRARVLFVYLFVCLFVCLFICLFVCLCVAVFMCLLANDSRLYSHSHAFFSHFENIGL
jgi:hypothetical protein